MKKKLRDVDQEVLSLIEEILRRQILDSVEGEHYIMRIQDDNNGIVFYSDNGYKKIELRFKKLGS